MNARKKRRKALERWRSRSAASIVPALNAIAEFGDFCAVALQQFAAAARVFANAAMEFASCIVSSIMAAMEPGSPVTIEELYASIGSDGAAEPRARFTGEGGFTLN